MSTPQAPRALYEKLGYREQGTPPRRVRGTIMLRGEPFSYDTVLLDLGYGQPRARDSPCRAGPPPRSVEGAPGPVALRSRPLGLQSEHASSTACSGVFARRTPSTGRPGSRITTRRPSIDAYAISASVPQLPPTAITASPLAATARFRACPTPVTISWSSHSLPACRSIPGRTPIVVPPAAFAPRAAAAMTSPRPPVTTTHPRPARSRPTSSARCSCSTPLPMTDTWIAIVRW